MESKNDNPLACISFKSCRRQRTKKGKKNSLLPCVSYSQSIRALIFVVVQSPSYRRFSENSTTIRNSSRLVPPRLLLPYARCRSPMCCVYLSLSCVLFLSVALILVLRLQSVGVVVGFLRIWPTFFLHSLTMHTLNQLNMRFCTWFFMRTHRLFQFG